jgi:hypothetical protein
MSNIRRQSQKFDDFMTPQPNTGKAGDLSTFQADQIQIGPFQKLLETDRDNYEHNASQSKAHQQPYSPPRNPREVVHQKPSNMFDPISETEFNHKEAQKKSYRRELQE